MTKDNKKSNDTQAVSRANYLSNPAEHFGKSSKNSRRVQLLVAVVLIFVIGGLLILKHNKPATGKVSINKVVSEVSRHYVLPTGEQPTLATVSDVEKVRSQSFFAHANNGDEVLIYAKAKKAILYRPSIDRILEIAPLTSGK